MEGNLRSQYRKDGFLHLSNFIPTEDIQQLWLDARGIFAKQIERVFGEEISPEDEAFDEKAFALFEKDLTTYINCSKQTHYLISLHEMSVHKKIIGMLKQMGLSNPVMSVRPAMLINSKYTAKAEHYWKLAAHQDWRSSQGSVDAVTVWLPLTDCDEQLGALQVIPSSHTDGLLDSNEEGYYSSLNPNTYREEDLVQLNFKQGDALFFSSWLIHASGNNQTRKIRWSIQLRYNNLDDKNYLERGFPIPYTYRRETDLATPGNPSKELVSSFWK